MNCSFCGKKILSRGITHINISQLNKVRYFCSRSCKESWCFEVQKNKAKIVLIWSIGAYLKRFFFVKKIITLKSMSILNDLKNKSFFAENLEDCATLRLSKNKDDSVFLKVVKE